VIIKKVINSNRHKERELSRYITKERLEEKPKPEELRHKILKSQQFGSPVQKSNSVTKGFPKE